MKEDKYKIISHLLDKYRKSDYSVYDHKSNGWYEYEKTAYKPEPTMSDVIDMIEKMIEKHPRNIVQILEALPEEEIQKFLRAKKLAKIKSK